MKIRRIRKSDLPEMIALYIDYYNLNEQGQWNEETTGKRISQILSRRDSYCLLGEEEGSLIGFVLGYFEQYDDGFVYDLAEILVASSAQNRGYGTTLMKELEKRVKKKGALLIQLQMVNDEKHRRFYRRLGYRTATNLILKSKIL